MMYDFIHTILQESYIFGMQKNPRVINIQNLFNMLVKHKHKSPKIFNYTNECNYAGMQGSEVHRTAVSQAKHFGCAVPRKPILNLNLFISTSNGHF